MRHAEILIGRVLFLEGTSTVSKLNPMHIGNSVDDQLTHDHEAEADAVANYNAAIGKVSELGDHGTRDVLTTILKDEEAQKDQIAQTR